MINNLQRVQIKIPSDASAGINLDPFLEIFGRWRKDKKDPAEWVDLADYAHLTRGAGIILVGQRCNIAFDLTDPGPGFLYAAKKGLSGSHPERILSAFQWCFEFAKRLAAEKEYPKDARLRTDSIELRFNDRLETPNDRATDNELQPAIRQLLDRLYGPKGYELIPQSDAAQAYGFTIMAKTPETPDALLDRITTAASSKI